MSNSYNSHNRPNYLNKTERASDDVYARLYQRAYITVCKQYPMRQDWQQDFPAYALAAFLRGRRGTVDQLLLDYVRSVGLNMRSNSKSKDELKREAFFMLNPYPIEEQFYLQYRGSHTENAMHARLDIRRMIGSIQGDSQYICFDMFINGFEQVELARLGDITGGRVNQLYSKGVKEIMKAIADVRPAEYLSVYDNMVDFTNRYYGTSYFAACRLAGGDVHKMYNTRKSRKSSSFVEIIERSNVNYQTQEVTNDT